MVLIVLSIIRSPDGDVRRVCRGGGESGGREGEELRHTFPLPSFLGSRETPWDFPAVVSWWSWRRGWEGCNQSFPPSSGEEARKGPNMVGTGQGGECEGDRREEGYVR